MPKLAQTTEQKKKELLLRRIKSQREMLGLAHPKDALSSRIGMGYATYTKKIKRDMDFSHKELIRIFTVLKFTTEMKDEVL